MSDSHKPILDREYAAEMVRYFKDIIDLLDEVLDYGSFLLSRAYGSSPKDIKANCLVFALFRQFLAHLDGVTSLLKTGNCSSANLQLRSLLEITHVIEWILISDTENKIHYFHVANLRRRRQKQSMAIPGTPEATRHAQAASRIPLTPEQLNEIKEEVKRIDKILAEPEFASINAKFEPHYLSKGFDKPWHKVYGKSIQQIANDIHKLNEYDYIYSSLSGVTHGSDMWKNVVFGEIISPNPLREPEDIAKLAKFAIPIAWRVYELILKQYRSGEAYDNFPRKVAEWQPRFRKEYSVKLSPQYTII
jgi:hypothetical protein